jgi:hypothetical protein
MFGNEYSNGKKKQCLHTLEQELIAALKGPNIEVSVQEIGKIGLLSALRGQIGE